MFAWQIFDAKIIPMLRDEYRIKQVTKVRADTLEAFVRKLEGGYSGDEFEEGTYDVNELDLGEDDGFFWDAENHPIVMIT